MTTRPILVAIVEDDPAMLRSIERLLAVYGFSTQSFSSAEAFLDQSASCEAKCLLLDIQLGGISGIELCRRLTVAGSELPVIFMTAVDNEETRRLAVELGCDSFLRKPIAPDVLIDAIEKAAA
jgi:FixJ family two-component response regulator